VASARGRELIEAGAIQHISRIPGALRNVSVWRARDATELHELLTSIAAYP
jgi:muconolactone D-isomerase